MILVLTLCDFNLFAKRTLAQAFMTLCNKMDDSLEMGPPHPTPTPPYVWGGLFPN